MMQPHGGERYGMHFPLRAGVEVLVAFVDGDPDRPIIVGAAPNTATPSPVDASNRRMNKLKTASGCVLEIFDGDA
jgi:type VI secretion system secreted protein VgrG